MQPTVTSIDQVALKVGPAAPQATENDFYHLRETLLNAVPGKFVEGWEGVVTHLVDAKLFEVDLQPVHETKPVLARLPLEWVKDAERDEVRPGRHLIWGVWEREQGGSKIRSNKLTLLPVPPVDLERARAAGERVAQMLQDD